MKETMKFYIRVLQFLKPHWRLISLSILLTFFYIIFNSASLWISVDFIRELFEPQGIQIEAAAEQNPDSKAEGLKTLLEGKDSFYREINLFIKKLIVKEDKYETLKMVCLLILVTFLMKNIIAYFRRLLLNFIELKIIVDLRNALNRAFLHLPLSYYEKHDSGEATSILFNDGKAMKDMLNNSFGRMMLAPMQILTNLVILVMISWKLSLITLTVVPLIALVIVNIGKVIRRRSRRVFKQIAQVLSVFQESVNAIRIVKAFTNEEKEIDKFEKANNKFFRTNFRANRIGYLTSPLNESLVVIVLIALLWYGGGMVYEGELMADDFMRYLIFLVTLFQPLKDVSQMNSVIQVGMAAAERVFGALDAVPEVYEKPGAREISGFNKNIVYKDVWFRYNDDEPYALKDINLTIAKGQSVAFVGHSGAGKSTLVDMIPRFYDTTRGTVSIDGVNVQDIALKSLRNQIGIVTQESILFNDTIRANIGYDKPDATDEEIIEAAKIANAWEFIRRMDQGLDTIVGERGNKLSGGQKQRLSIARAVLKNPPILILDEATSALDTESERLVQNAITRLMQKRTVLVIAHRLSTITNVDKIVVMKQGEIVETGTHRELLEKSGIYRTLTQSQFIETA